MNSPEPAFDPQRCSDQARIRNAAAGMIKNLVAARSKANPVWAQAEMIDKQWFSTTKRPQHRSVIFLLEQAASGFQRFANDYSGPLDSVSCEDQDDESPTALIERLKDLLCQFINHEELTEAADQLQRHAEGNVAWNDLANWDLLPQLRELLDQLPDHSDQRLPKAGDQHLSTDSFGIVCHGGRRLKCPPQTWKLLHHLLQQRKRRCYIADLAEPIWDDHSKEVKTADVDSVLKRANKWLENSKIHYFLRRAKLEVHLIESEVKSATEPPRPKS